MWPLIKKQLQQNSIPRAVEYTQSTFSLCQCCFCKLHLIWTTVKAEYAQCISFAFVNIFVAASIFHLSIISNLKEFRLGYILL